MCKRLFLLALVTLFVVACSISEDNSDVFEGEKLKGMYIVAVTPLEADTINQQSADTGWAFLGKR